MENNFFKRGIGPGMGRDLARIHKLGATLVEYEMPPITLVQQEGVTRCFERIVGVIPPVQTVCYVYFSSHSSGFMSGLNNIRYTRFGFL